MAQAQRPRCKHLVLDAGPLLSLSPLRGLAEIYLTVPQVLDELQDKRAREHFEQLGLSAGVRVEIRSPDANSLAKVIEGAKKTGDYSVLSHADLCILALTYGIHAGEVEEAAKRDVPVQSFEITPENSSSDVAEAVTPASTSEEISLSDKIENLELEGNRVDDMETTHLLAERSQQDEAADAQLEPLNVELHSVSETEDTPPPTNSLSCAREAPSATAELAPSTTHASASDATSQTLYDDPSESDDGEGEWITPSNVAIHKSRAMNLLPTSTAGQKAPSQAQMGAGCMTADFAMQNVLLQMGLNLVGMEGKRIQRVKTWVLRCHACFKICKDSSRQFCPTCGNATLLRASVTIASPDAGPNTPAMQVHLKKNFQYKLRGTIYSIPSPKPGSAKTGPGEGLILREDQAEYARARKKADAQRERNERKMLSGALARGAKGDEGGVSVGSWMDPDWVPEMISVGSGGKGRTRGKGELPTIGYGRKNPNERKRKT